MNTMTQHQTPDQASADEHSSTTLNQSHTPERLSAEQQSGTTKQQSNTAAIHSVHPRKEALPAVHAHNISFSYDHGATWTLQHCSIDIPRGQYIAIVGRNGSGKSTLGRLIAGLTAPDSGTLQLCGHTVFDQAANSEAYRAARHQIGVVFQQPDDQLVATVVEDDVAFGPENLGVPPQEIRKRVTESLQQVDLLSRQHRDPLSMSGGQQQRVAIAGMLAMHASMIVLDEPCAMLDMQAREDVHTILRRLHAQGTTIVHITHTMQEALLADRIIVMRDGMAHELSHDEAVAFFDADTQPIDQSIHQTAQQSMQRSVGHKPDTGQSIEQSGEQALDAKKYPPHTGNTTYSTSTHPPAHTALWRSSNTPGAVVLDAQHITYQFANAETATIDDYSIQLRAGTITALQGENGSGKTTLVRLLSGIITAQSGSVSVCGLPLVVHKRDGRSGKRNGGRGVSQRVSAKARSVARRHIGYVMQHPEHQLFAETVAEDIAFGPRNQHLTEQQVEQRVQEALELVGISHLAQASPFALSGGQQRLVAIAGVLACHPDVVIWDEPTSSLDIQASARIQHIMLALRARGIASLVITHKNTELALADQVITLHKVRKNSTANEDNTLSEPTGTRAEHTATLVANVTGSPHTATATTTAIATTTAATTASNVARRPAFQMLDPRVALVGTLAIMLTSFAVNSLWALLVTGVITCGIIVAARISLKHLFITIHPFVILFAIMWLMNLWFTQEGDTLWQWGILRITDLGLWFATVYFCRFMAVILIGAVLITSTTTVALIDAMNSLLTPLAKLGMHTDELSLVASLALRFVPTLGMEARDIMNAQAARGGSIDAGSLSQRIRAMSAIIVPVFAGALRHADHLALALDARCYEGGAHRTHMRQMKLTWRDAVYMMIAFADIACIIAFTIMY